MVGHLTFSSLHELGKVGPTVCVLLVTDLTAIVGVFCVYTLGVFPCVVILISDSHQL